MKTNTSTPQKIGWVIFTIGALYMFGLGWLYSWLVVPAANQVGSDAYSGLLGFIWGLSVPLGAFIVAIAALGQAKVWDLPSRVSHWALVLLVSVGAVTGFLGPEWWMGIHVWAGYGMAALVTFRIVWGVFGPEYSRVVSFLYPRRSTLEHARGLLLLRPPHYVGHNPTGALMVFALAGVLIALVTTGLLSLGGEEKQGPLALVVGYSVGDGAKGVHLVLTRLLLGMSILHVAGVVTESLLTRDGLVRVFPRSFESPTRIASTFAADEILGRPHSYWYEYRRRIDAVTAERVLAAAQKYLRPDALAMLVVGNWSEIEPGDAQGRAKMAELFGGRVEHLPLRDPLTLAPLP